jgi:cell division protein FtsB
MSKKYTDTERKIESPLTDQELLDRRADELSEKNLERAIKKGFKEPYVKVIARVMLTVLLVASIGMFVTSLMRYSELQREKQALEDKVEKYEAEVEKLEYLIDSPIDYDYIVRVAREKLNLYLPNEIIYHNDTNK